MPKLQSDVQYEVSEILDLCSEPFKDFNIEYKLLKELESRQFFKYPTKYTINNEVTIITSDNNPTMDEKNAKGILMPIRHQFKTLFELPMVLNKTLGNMEILKKDKTISNFYNSKLMKKKTLSF